MQRIYFIEKMSPLRDIPYTGRDGQPQVISKQGFLLSDGINTLYAETLGSYAKAAQALKLQEGQCVSVQMDVTARSWTTQEGETRYENSIHISNIAPFGCSA